MANLVFKGHKTRGKELHKLLENLGGVDAGYMGCSCITCYYYINREGYIEGSNAIPLYMDKRVIMELEEFEQKYPYKVGDKVNYVKYNDGYPSVYTIQRMRWTGVTIEYLLDSSGFSALTKDLQPYKEEVMDEKGTLVEIDLTKEFKVADEVEVILGDYEFVLKDGKTYFVKKKPKYPKTYDVCLEILGYNTSHTIPMNHGHKCFLFMRFQKLLICRDAYWKIAGKWTPDWLYDDAKYVLMFNSCEICKDAVKHTSYVLAFPTEEMRDAFYENFKELIEECKELL